MMIADIFRTGDAIGWQALQRSGHRDGQQVLAIHRYCRLMYESTQLSVASQHPDSLLQASKSLIVWINVDCEK